MKLQPLAIGILPYVHALHGELLSSSLPNSACQRKKTSLGGRLPLPQAQLVSPPVSFFFPSPLLHTCLISSSRLLKLQVTSNPA